MRITDAAQPRGEGISRSRLKEIDISRLQLKGVPRDNKGLGRLRPNGKIISRLRLSWKPEEERTLSSRPNEVFKSYQRPSVTRQRLKEDICELTSPLSRLNDLTSHVLSREALDAVDSSAESISAVGSLSREEAIVKSQLL